MTLHAMMLLQGERLYYMAVDVHWYVHLNAIAYIKALPNCQAVIYKLTVQSLKS